MRQGGAVFPRWLGGNLLDELEGDLTGLPHRGPDVALDSPEVRSAGRQRIGEAVMIGLFRMTFGSPTVDPVHSSNQNLTAMMY